MCAHQTYSSCLVYMLWVLASTIQLLRTTTVYTSSFARLWQWPLKGTQMDGKRYKNEPEKVMLNPRRIERVYLACYGHFRVPWEYRILCCITTPNLSCFLPMDSSWTYRGSTSWSSARNKQNSSHLSAVQTCCMWLSSNVPGTVQNGLGIPFSLSVALARIGQPLNPFSLLQEAFRG